MKFSIKLYQCLLCKEYILEDPPLHHRLYHEVCFNCQRIVLEHDRLKAKGILIQP